ncbi:MAG: hypothetical protein JW846_02340 [Dehalococcoidia bacterium]|nr:hypothetical protein [Dehalococcoidia bacterium]
MKRNKSNAEKRFSNDVELLLKGQEPGHFEQDADYARTLQFAQRLMTLREEPHPEFQQSLRGRLLNKRELLEESSQSDRNPSLFERLFGSPSLRLAVVSSFVILVAVGLVWRAGLFSPAMTQPSDEAMTATMEEDGAMALDADEGEKAASLMEGAAPEAPSPPPSDAEQGTTGEAARGNVMPVAVRIYVEPSNAHGSAISMSVVFRNAGPDTLILEPFPPVVTIRQAGTSNVVRTFVAGSSQLGLSPMEETQYSIEWDQKDFSGTQVPSGRYELSIDTFEVRLGTDKTTQGYGSEVVAFEIAQPEPETQE